MKPFVAKIKEVRNASGCGFDDAKHALILLDNDVEGAVEFLRIIGQAVSRYKRVDGINCPWNVEDYVRVAKERVK